MSDDGTRKPTIGELFEQEPDAEAFFRKVKQHYPGVSLDDVMAEVQREVDQRAAEYETLARINEIMRGEEGTVTEVLRRKAEAGDKEAEELLALIDDPMLRQFWDEFQTAAEKDPHWEKRGKGRWAAQPGSAHDTPEKLVEAARRARWPLS